MPYSLQSRATTGRRQYSPFMTGKPPYFPQKPEVMPEMPIMPSQPLFTPKPFYGTGPPGDTDPSQGLAEGVSNPGGFAPTNQANMAGLAAQKGEYGKAALHGLQGLMASTIGMPASVVDAIIGPIVNKGYEAVKGFLGFSDPANSGSSVASGVGISGISGPMGLAHAEAMNNQGVDLSGLNMGGVGDGIGGTPSVGGSVPGAIGLGIGTGGMDAGLGVGDGIGGGIGSGPGVGGGEAGDSGPY